MPVKPYVGIYLTHRRLLFHSLCHKLLTPHGTTMTHPDMIDTGATRRGARPGSLTDRLLALEVGQEHSMTVYLDPSQDDVSEEGLSAAKTKLTNTASKTIARIKQTYPKMDFQTESAVIVTSRNRIYAIVLVTRTE